MREARSALHADCSEPDVLGMSTGPPSSDDMHVVAVVVLGIGTGFTVLLLPGLELPPADMGGDGDALALALALRGVIAKPLEPTPEPRPGEERVGREAEQVQIAGSRLSAK